MFFLVLLDADCSGRTLATLLVAWVTTAMVAAILLKWEYMWIVLAILTLLFLLVCGYTAYNVKRTHARILIEQQRAIRTVSSIAAANRREIELSTYSTHLHTDLPPSYASVMTTQTTTSTSPRASSGEDKYEDPPSYSIVIASLDNTQENRNAEISSESNVSPSKFTNNAADAAAATSASTSITYPHGR